MPESFVVLSQIRDVAVVTFSTTSLLDPAQIEIASRELYGLADLQAQRKIVLDFSGVNFFSSQLLGTLLSLDKRCKAIDGRLILCGLKPQLKRVFQTANLDRLFVMVSDEETALNKLGTSGSY